MKPEILHTCENCTCVSTPFRFLSTDELAFINRNRIEIKFRKGENLCKQGTSASHVIYLRSGLIKIISEENRGNLVLSIEAGGYFLGLQVLFKPQKLPFSVVASEDTLACLWDINAFRELAERNAGFAAGMLRYVTDDIIRSYQWITTLGLKHVHGRLSDLLICLSEHIYKSSKFTTSLARKDMAQITNMSPE
ncbi:MAG: Crp/Fnr family transcriptional regulator, partial [Bacteroidota bacterium]|nr:Crp/Fnr family transcriptional regulator [Bacteroidota bacterium]